MTPQLTHTLTTFAAMTAYALVVGGAFYFLCLFFKKLGVLTVLETIIIFAWFVAILISSAMISVLLQLCFAAGFCALLKTPDNRSWKSNLRFLLVSGSSSVIFGSMLFGLISSYIPRSWSIFWSTDMLFLLLAVAPCAISAMHAVLVSSGLRPGIDRHLHAEEVD